MHTLLPPGETADHPITRSQQHVIWSLGQVFPDYFHNPASGIEAGTAEDRMFYKRDEIKYHGTRNRGVTTANFYGKHEKIGELLSQFFLSDRTFDGGDDVCSNQFATGCQDDRCDYSARWTVGAGMIRFTLKARTTGWVAVGFSDDRLMVI